MHFKQFLLFFTACGVIDCRKIGITNPVKEIIYIFLTLGGVCLFLLALCMYLSEKGYILRISRYFRQFFGRNWLNEEVE